MITKKKTTAEEFETTAASLGSCELVRGEVVPLSPGGTKHSKVASNVTGLLWQWARQSKLGRVWSGEAGLVVESDPDTVRGADAAYISYKRLPRGEEPEGFATVPPELVVEIVGKGQGWGKMVEKAGEYLGMGVDCVWVVDPKSRRLHVFRPDGEPTVLDERQSVSDENILPGFSCEVREFFSE